MIVKLVAIDLIVVVISDVLNVGIVGVKIEVDVVVMVWLWWYNRCCVFVDDVVVVVLIRKKMLSLRSNDSNLCSKCISNVIKILAKEKIKAILKQCTGMVQNTTPILV